tara:strand:+ start:367 stop:495 length:129 start_codon:yes stop_codon:yes gene_type:complete
MEKIIKFFKKWDQIWIMIGATLGLSLVAMIILVVLGYIVERI